MRGSQRKHRSRSLHHAGAVCLPPAMPTMRAPRLLAYWPAIDPVAPPAAETTTVSPACGLPILVIPVQAVKDDSPRSPDPQPIGQSRTARIDRPQPRGRGGDFLLPAEHARHKAARRLGHALQATERGLAFGGLDHHAAPMPDPRKVPAMPPARSSSAGRAIHTARQHDAGVRRRHGTRRIDTPPKARHRHGGSPRASPFGVPR